MPDIPTEPHCTPDQCDDAISYLMAGFGPWYDDQEKRQLRRLFLDYSPQEATAAIDQLVKHSDGRGKPRSGDLGAVLKANRRFLRSRGAEKVTPDYASVPVDDEVARRHEIVAAIKSGDHERVKQLTGEVA